MKQIKTIKINFEAVEDFDRAVNESISKGWTLTKREVLPAYDGGTILFHRMLYAELEMNAKCENCKHHAREGQEEPCCECYGYEKWEEKE